MVGALGALWMEGPSREASSRSGEIRDDTRCGATPVGGHDSRIDFADEGCRVAGALKSCVSRRFGHGVRLHRTLPSEGDGNCGGNAMTSSVSVLWVARRVRWANRRRVGAVTLAAIGYLLAYLVGLGAGGDTEQRELVTQIAFILLRPGRRRILLGRGGAVGSGPTDPRAWTGRRASPVSELDRQLPVVYDNWVRRRRSGVRRVPHRQPYSSTPIMLWGLLSFPSPRGPPRSARGSGDTGT